MEVKEEIKYEELKGAAMMLTPEFIDDFEGNGLIDFCRDVRGHLKPHVIEYSYGGNEMQDLWNVRRVGKFEAVIKIFTGKRDESQYLNQNKMVHGGEFLHKDFENPLSVFHKSFVKRVIKRRR